MKFKNFEKFDLFFFVVTVILILIFAVFAKAQSIEIQAPEIAASSGAFTLGKTVIAGGGSAKQGAAFSEHGTIGQSIAGIKSSGGQFSISGGFWTPENFAPTAGGRVKTNAGKGIRNVNSNRHVSERRNARNRFRRLRLLSVRRHSGGSNVYLQRFSQTLCFQPTDISQKYH